MHVLVAEDEEVIALSLESALLERGHRVHVARDGREALEVAAAHGPWDALLTDYRMPWVMGDELARRMLVGDPGLVVVILSGDARSETLCVMPPGPGQVALLRKPMDPDDVADFLDAKMAAHRIT